MHHWEASRPRKMTTVAPGDIRYHRRRNAVEVQVSGAECGESGPGGLFTALPLEMGRMAIETILGQKLLRAEALILPSLLAVESPADGILEDVIEGLHFTFERGELGVHWAWPGQWRLVEGAGKAFAGPKPGYCIAIVTGEVSRRVWREGSLSLVDVSTVGLFQGLIGERLIAAEMFGWAGIPHGLVLESAADSVGVALGVFGRKLFGDADDVLVAGAEEVRLGGRLPVEDKWDALTRVSVG